MNVCLSCSLRGKHRTREGLVIRTILLAMLAVCAMFLLSACNSTSNEPEEEQIVTETQTTVEDQTKEEDQTTAEDQILTDIQAGDNYFGGYNLQVESFSVSKRQTNVDDKTDFVWCKVIAANNDFTYSADYKVTYVLYNEGWMLEECSKENASIKVKQYPTENQALVTLRKHFPNAKEISIVESTQIDAPITDTSITFLFKVVTVNKYHLEWRTIYAVICNFTPESGWKATIEERR